MTSFKDLKIVNGDFDFGIDGEPVYLTDTAVIAQDLQIRLMEAGTAAGLVGDDEGGLTVPVAIKAQVEQDARIEPGTVAVIDSGGGIYFVTALTLTGAALTLTLG